MTSNTKALELRPDHNGVMLCLKRVDLSPARMRWYRERFDYLWELSSIAKVSVGGDEGDYILWRDPFDGGLLETAPVPFMMLREVSEPVVLYVSRTSAQPTPGLFTLTPSPHGRFGWMAADLKQEARVDAEFVSSVDRIPVALLALVSRLSSQTLPSG